jgi:CRP-like cAMP-binding protein
MIRPVCMLDRQPTPRPVGLGRLSPLGATGVAESPTVLYELTAQKLYTCYKADIHACVMVMQNISRELCRRLRRADNRIAELQLLHAIQ